MSIRHVDTRHWDRDEFIRAWEAGDFNGRVELIEGEVWPVVTGGRHDWIFDIAALLSRPGVRVKPGFLPSGESLPVPDCWVRRYAQPVAPLSRKLSTWDPADVLLVVEVSDENVAQDLEIKSRIYGRAGWPVYWVVTPTVVYEHTEPFDQGYRNRVEYLPGQMLPLRYASTEVSIDDVIAPIP
ncbi:MAG: Uma2 family endonuclease [Micromonosporaceae bacterium]|nr:Uma2 family endonuclease [Micromonosporaceae bacterium]